MLELTPLTKYLGSLVHYPPHHSSWWSKHTVYLDEHEIEDEFLKDVYAGIRSLADINALISSEGVADEILAAGGSTNQTESFDQLSLKRAELTTRVDSLAAFGAQSETEFRRAQGMLQEFVTKQGIQRLVKLIPNWNEKGLTPSQQARKLQSYLDKITGRVSFDEVFLNLEAQRQYLVELQRKQKALVGQPVFTLPVQWNLQRFIPRVVPGHIVCLSAGTSYGKSAISNQWADIACRTGHRVLYVHMEDTPDQILWRQCCRWVDGAFWGELERGDKRKKMDELQKIKESWYKRGGVLDYLYLPAYSPTLTLRLIRDKLTAALLAGVPYDLVALDYIQLMDFESEIKQGASKVNIIGNFMARFKSMVITFRCVGLVVSQVTQDKVSGDTSPKDGKVIADQSQIHIDLKRNIVRDPSREETVIVNGHAQVLAEVGQRSNIGTFEILKATGGLLGRQEFFFNPTTFSATTREYEQRVRREPSYADHIPTLTDLTAEMVARGEEIRQAYRQFITEHSQ